MYTILTDSHSYQDLVLLLDKDLFLVLNYNSADSGKILFFGKAAAQRMKNICSHPNYSYLDLSFSCDLLGLDLDLDLSLKELSKRTDIQALILFSLEHQDSLSADPQDAFIPHIPNYYKLNFGLYLGENPSTLNLIETCIKREKRLMIEASAGTGKTTAIKTYLDAGLNTGAQRLIFCVPTLPIAQQTEQAILNGLDTKNISVVLACESQDKIHSQEQESLGSFKIVICVYDSLYKVIHQDLIKDAILVIDEFQMLVSEKGYRRDFDYNQALKAHRTILLSATPNFLFCLDNPYLGFKLLRCFTSADNVLDMYPTFYKSKNTHLLSTIKKAIKTHNLDESKTIFIKKDNKNFIKASIQNLQRDGFKCDAFFSGENGTYKENNDNYNQALRTGTMTEKQDFLFSTKLIEAGFSLKFDCDTVILDAKHWSNIVQTSIRPRYDKRTGTNKNVKIVLMMGERSKGYPSPKFKSAAQYFFNEYAQAHRQAEHLNSFNFQSRPTSQDQNLESDILTKFVLENDNKEHFVNVLELLFDIHKEDLKTSSLELNLQRIKRIDKRFNIHEITHLSSGVSSCEFLEQVLENRKEDRNKAKILAQEDLKLFCYAAIYKGRNYDLKKQIKGIDPTFDSEKVKDFAETNKTILNTSSAKLIVQNYTFWKDRTTQDSLMDFCFLGVKQSTQAKEKRILFERAKENKKALQGSPSADISKVKNYEHEIYKQLRRTIRELNKTNKKRDKDLFIPQDRILAIFGGDVQKIKKDLGLETCAFDNYTANKVMSLISKIFNVESKRIGREQERKTVYFLKLKD